LGKVVAIGKEDGTVDLGSGKWRVTNCLLGILAASQVAAFRTAHRVKMVIIGDRRTRWMPLVARIVSVPSRWLIRVATGSQKS
jgi:hypothetical protein